MAKRVARNRQDAPKMTSHHFEYIAHMLRNLPWYLPGEAIATVHKDGGYHLAATDEDLARAVAKQLQATNPRFDPDTFIEAVRHG